MIIKITQIGKPSLGEKLIRNMDRLKAECLIQFSIRSKETTNSRVIPNIS